MGLEGPITHGVANNHSHHWSPFCLVEMQSIALAFRVCK